MKLCEVSKSYRELNRNQEEELQTCGNYVEDAGLPLLVQVVQAPAEQRPEVVQRLRRVGHQAPAATRVDALLRDLHELTGRVESPPEFRGLRVGFDPTGHVHGLETASTVHPFLAGGAHWRICARGG